MQVHQKGFLLIEDLILTTDEGDISGITYSPGIGKSDHLRLQFYLYTNIRRHYTTREYCQCLVDKADYSQMREMMLMITGHSNYKINRHSGAMYVQPSMTKEIMSARREERKGEWVWRKSWLDVHLQMCIALCLILKISFIV